MKFCSLRTVRTVCSALLLTMCQGTLADELTGIVMVEISGLKDAAGNVYIAVYDSDATWLGDEAVMNKKVVIAESLDGDLVRTELQVPLGSYALSAFYDKDYEKLRAAIATRTIHRVIYSVDFFAFNSFDGMPPDYILEFSNRLSRRSSLWSNTSFVKQVLQDYSTAFWSYAALSDSIGTLKGQQAAESRALFYTDLFDNGLMRIDGGKGQSQRIAQYSQRFSTTEYCTVIKSLYDAAALARRLLALRSTP